MIGWVAAATAAEVAALVAVVHTLLHHAMLARGLPAWRLADTLLTSPLLWTGATLFAGSLNGLVVVAALSAGAASVAPTALAALAALAGAVVAWFGMRAVGKLY